MKAGECRKLLERWREEGSFERLLPEVVSLRGVPQPERFHGEGDAFTHTMMALTHVDNAVDGRVFWGVLLHDIGKASTTSFIRGRWRAYGHAEAGARMVPRIMERVGYPELSADVSWLVREHLFHFFWEIGPDSRLTRAQQRFMVHPLFPLLLEVCRADTLGAIGTAPRGDKITLIWELYEELYPDL